MSSTLFPVPRTVLAFGSVFGTIGLALGVGAGFGIAADPPLGVFFLVDALVLLGIGVMCLGAALHRPALTDAELVLPRPLRGERRIALTDVSEVCLRYHRSGRVPGWELRLSDSTGSHLVPMDRPPFGAVRRAGDPAVARRGAGRPPTWDGLASTTAGRAALAIWQRAAALQRADGPLSHGPVSSPFDTPLPAPTWWPDGRLDL